MKCSRSLRVRLTPTRRCLHTVPTLRLRNPETEGIGNLYTAQGYKTAWTDYQTFAIDNLNRVAAETDYESLPLIKTIAQTARQPEHAVVYNFAAQAFSNHFYFDSLKTDETTIPDDLKRLIDASFNSMDDFKAHFSATAESMLGSGWVWLVLDASSQLRILATYNAGTPFDFQRLQNTDPNTGLATGSSLGKKEHDYALYQALKRPYSLTPVACLSVWQHSYITDYGVAGKRAYVDKFFENLDWEKIAARINEAKPTRQDSSRYSI